MKKFTFKRQLLFVMLMLLGCLSIQAADDGLITNQVVITLDRPGTLPQKISASDKYLITNLKVKGDINGTDLGLLREMTGQSINGVDETDGKLSTLDLSDAKIVGGGEPYFNYGGYETYFTEYDKIGKNAFSSCTSLKNLTLPKDITSIEQSAFFGCTGLTSITIPSYVTSISKYAFSGCSNLTNVDFPSSITSIGHYGFYKCYSLTNLTLPSNLNSIGDWAFDYCSSLTSLTINSNITKLGYSVFTACNSLKNLTFSTNVTSIADLLFFNSFDNLEAVYVGWQNPIEAGSFFTYIKISNCTLYVPQGTKEAYANADIWKDFGNIIEYDATGIDKVTNRSDVKEISRYSLNGQRVTSPTKGVNIVVYSDGSIKKVAVQ